MSDLDGHVHIDSALVRRVTDAQLGHTQLTPSEVLRMWCEIQYLSDELRKTKQALADAEFHAWLKYVFNLTSEGEVIDQCTTK